MSGMLSQIGTLSNFFIKLETSEKMNSSFGELQTCLFSFPFHSLMNIYNVHAYISQPRLISPCQCLIYVANSVRNNDILMRLPLSFTRKYEKVEVNKMTFRNLELGNKSVILIAF